jgi:hypothetical protein
MKIVNLTQHASTPEQIAAGVVDLPPEIRGVLVELLTLDDAPTWRELEERCRQVATLAAEGCHMAAMIGGAPAMQAALEAALLAVDILPMYAFSKRTSVEQTLPDGSVRKVAVFRHAGWWPTNPAWAHLLNQF